MSKPISPRLARMLASDIDLYVADTYEFYLYNAGIILRYTNGDADIRGNGKLYSAGGIQIGPYFDAAGNRSAARWERGIGVDTLEFEVLPGAAMIAGVPFLTAVQQGVFDGADLIKNRWFMPTYGDTRCGPINIFSGRVADVIPSRSKAVFSINSYMELLDQNFPRNLFQAGCVNNLGDTSCGVNLPALGVPLTVTTSTLTVIGTTIAVAPAGQFNQGKILFTSGALSGLSRTVKLATAGAPGSVELLFPLPVAAAPGDGFTIYPGCDKSYAGANGCAKFSNQARFRGEDKIPIVETAV